MLPLSGCDDAKPVAKVEASAAAKPGAEAKPEAEPEPERSAGLHEGREVLRSGDEGHGRRSCPNREVPWESHAECVASCISGQERDIAGNVVRLSIDGGTSTLPSVPLHIADLIGGNITRGDGLAGGAGLSRRGRE